MIKITKTATIELKNSNDIYLMALLVSAAEIQIAREGKNAFDKVIAAQSVVDKVAALGRDLSRQLEGDN